MWPKKNKDSQNPEAKIMAGFPAAFTCYRPNRPGPLVLASPHSGRIYPKAFTKLTNLSVRELRSGEDAYMDIIVESMRGGSAGFIHALFPRCFVDANRASDEIYENDVIGGTYGEFTASAHAKAGLGVVPVRAGRFKPIYSAPLTAGIIKARLDTFYHPYHHALRGLIEAAKTANGAALLADIHSMPPLGPYGMRPADIVIGDCHGTSCAPNVTQAVMTVFKNMGYKTACNTPYAGGYTSRHYGQPAQGTSAIQIEINKALYWDAQALQLTRGFDVLRRNMKSAICQIQDYFQNQLPAQPYNIAAQ